jgi:predicted lipase
MSRKLVLILLVIAGIDNFCVFASPQQVSSPLTMGSTKPSTAPTPDDDYKWPENLYIEMRDMAEASFMVYTIAYVVDVSRKVGLKGIEVSDEGRVGMPSRDLYRSFTPGEVLNVVQDNREALAEKYEPYFGNEIKYQQFVKHLRTMQEQADASKLDRPLTLEEFDDKHQESEMVYGVIKDDLNKRIVLVFRGTENALAMKSNWSANLYSIKTKAPVPELLKDVATDGLNVHSGFYNYVFSPTKDRKDDSEFTKQDEICEDVKLLLKKHPTYKLYVTGHSLGAALSTLVSFYLACDPEIPKPVTNISFASPRLGDSKFLKATKWLEEQKMLRVFRVANDQDSVAVFPILQYHHVGIEALLYKDVGENPVMSYPKDHESWGGWAARLWG